MELLGPDLTEELGRATSEMPAVDRPEAPAPTEGAVVATAPASGNASYDAQEPSAPAADVDTVCDSSNSGHAGRASSAADAPSAAGGAEEAAAAEAASGAGQPPSTPGAAVLAAAAAAELVPDAQPSASNSISSQCAPTSSPHPSGAQASADEDLSMLPPNHPLLRRAQEALNRQLADQKLRLQEELRERKKALKVRAAAPGHAVEKGQLSPVGPLLFAPAAALSLIPA